MALIIKCRSCRRRVPQGTIDCPDCGSIAFRFAIDYWPNGRRGGRKKITLPAETDLGEAKRHERVLMGVKRRPVVVASSSLSTVADLFPGYLKWCRVGDRRRPGTCRDINLTWEKSISPILGQYQVRDIAPEYFSLYQQNRAGKVKNRTVNKELDYFAGFLKWCRREKKIDIPAIHYEKLPCSRPLPVVLSPEEVSRIMQAAEREPFYRTFFLCLYALGFRFSEVRFLRLEDFDFENRAVKVRQKGGTEKVLPLSDQVIDAVKDLVDLWPMKPREYLFGLKKMEGEPIGDVRAAIKRICKAAGVTKRVTPHLMRHSIASHLMASDVNASIIQRFLGHKNILTTQWYSHVSMADLRRAQGLFSGEVSTGNPQK